MLYLPVPFLPLLTGSLSFNCIGEVGGRAITSVIRWCPDGLTTVTGIKLAAFDGQLPKAQQPLDNTSLLEYYRVSDFSVSLSLNTGITTPVVWNPSCSFAHACTVFVHFTGTLVPAR